MEGRTQLQIEQRARLEYPTQSTCMVKIVHNRVSLIAWQSLLRTGLWHETLVSRTNGPAHLPSAHAKQQQLLL